MSLLAWIQWLGLGNTRALVSGMAHIENVHFRFHKHLLAAFECIVDFGIAAMQQVLVDSLKDVLCDSHKLP